MRQTRRALSLDVPCVVQKKGRRPKGSRPRRSRGAEPKASRGTAGPGSSGRGLEGSTSRSPNMGHASGSAIRHSDNYAMRQARVDALVLSQIRIGRAATEICSPKLGSAARFSKIPRIYQSVELKSSVRAGFRKGGTTESQSLERSPQKRCAPRFGSGRALLHSCCLRTTSKKRAANRDSGRLRMVMRQIVVGICGSKES